MGRYRMRCYYFVLLHADFILKSNRAVFSKVKALKKTSVGLLHTGTVLPFVLLAVGLLGGCQLEPAYIDFSPPAIVSLPDAAGERQPKLSDRQPKLADIATRKFALDKDPSIVGSLAVVNARDGDTLPDIARHFGLGYNEATIANPTILPWMPKAGARVLLPLQFILPDAPRKGIVLNLASMRMFYYPPKQQDTVFTYPVGIGRQNWNTPLGQTTIVAKTANPTWTVPESIRREHAAKGDPLPQAVPPGPDNPLGKYALQLGIKRYLIHGTNKPYGVGMQVSHGCVRLYPEDIEMLFKKKPVGMPVRIIHQPYMTAWKGDMLYLEAHEPLEKWAKQKPKLKKKLINDLKQISTNRNVAIDWEKVDRILQSADGIPAPILTASPDLPELVANAPELEHPKHFYGAPKVPKLTGSDWAILVAAFDNEGEAQQLAAMLNHQGPPMPARKVEKDGSYQVIAGPFKNQKAAELAAHRLKMDFDLDSRLLQPEIVASPQPSHQLGKSDQNDTQHGHRHYLNIKKTRTRRQTIKQTANPLGLDLGRKE
jgi:L,D-transpeptidase ErfK/SrfK